MINLVRAWPRHLSLITQLSIVESILLRLEVATVFDNLNTKGFEALVLQLLDLVHRFLDIVESTHNSVLPRSGIRDNCLISLLLLVHQLVIIRQ